MEKQRQKTWKRLVLSLFVFSCCHLAHAQVDKSLLSRYPPSVIYKTWQVDKKVELSPEQQKAFAEYFLRLDKQAGLMIKENDWSALDKCYRLSDEFLQKTLSELQYCDYLFASVDNCSELIRAVKYRTDLKLTNGQLAELLKSIHTIYPDDGNESHELTMNSFEAGVKLRKVLSPIQFQTMIKLIAAPMAEAQNKQAWKQLITAKYAAPKDSASLYQENKVYFEQVAEMELQAMNTLSMHDKIDSIRESYFAIKPIILWKMDLPKNSFPPSQFADVLKLRDELKLSDKQVDSLLSYAHQLEIARANFKVKESFKKYDATKFEARYLLHALNQFQYEKYLINKNRSTAVVNEKKLWTRIRQYGLNNGVDSARVNNELLNYEVNLLVANDRVHNNDSSQNMLLRATIERNKPDILKKLDLAIKTPNGDVNANSNKTLSW